MGKGTGRSKQARVKRVMDERAPKIVENPKKALILRGTKASESVRKALHDLAKLKDPHCVRMQKKNAIVPFSDPSSFEFFSSKMDASMFVFGSHSKKRPNNLVMGRLFNHKLFDMYEFGLDRYVGLEDVPGEKCAYNTKPCMVFQGDAFENDTTFRAVKELFLDFFRGEEVSDVALASLDHAIVATAANDRILLRVYNIAFRKSGTRLPRVELDLMGPSMDLSLRRTQQAPPDLRKQALKRPAGAAAKKVKNVERSALGDRMGRVHMTKQNLDEAALHHPKALLKRARGKDKQSKATGAAEKADPPAQAAPAEDEDAPPKKGRRKAKR